MKSKTLFWFLILTSILSSSVFAQKKFLTLREAAWDGYFNLMPKELRDLAWLPNTHDIVYVNHFQNLEKRPIKGEFDTILNVKELATLDFSPKYFYKLNWIDDASFYYIYKKHNILICNAKTKKIENIIKLPKDADQIFYNPKAQKVAFKRHNNLFIADKNSNITQITFDTDTNIVNGGDYVHRQEFGIDHGIFWSPKGNYVAFYHEDMRPVSDYPLIDFRTYPATLHMIKYPMNGQKSEIVTLGIYDIKNNKVIYLEKKGDPEHYLTCITWDPSEKYIYIAELNRDQNFMKLNKYNINTGKLVKTLFTEKNKKYVEPMNPLFFFPKSKNKFLWLSRRDGYRHLYLYDTDGHFIKQITKGNWEITDFYGFSPDEKYIYIQATKESPLERHIYKVNIKTGKIWKLTDVHGVHNAIFSSDFKYFIDDYSNTETPHVIEVRDNKGKKISTILNADDPLKDYDLGTLKIGTIKAADNKTDLYYRMILPPNFDKTKKYPLLVYVYGGPHLQLIRDTWLADAQLWLYYMAEQGYVVFTLDNRGSDNRGLKFENVTFRHLGIEEMKDQIKGINYVKSLGFIDPNRIGVHGWSFGGYMTISLLTTYPDVFKVGVAGGPVVDWKYYEVMYGERYMDTEKTNPKGFKETSLLNKIQNLKAHLLIIHGMVDPIVVPQHTMQLLMQAQKKHIQIDYYPYPHQEHNVKDTTRIHLMRKITDYLNKYLMQGCN